jgi:hypothetical protein
MNGFPHYFPGKLNRVVIIRDRRNSIGKSRLLIALFSPIQEMSGLSPVESPKQEEKLTVVLDCDKIPVGVFQKWEDAIAWKSKQNPDHTYYVHMVDYVPTQVPNDTLHGITFTSGDKTFHAKGDPGLNSVPDHCWEDF